MVHAIPGNPFKGSRELARAYDHLLKNRPTRTTGDPLTCSFWAGYRNEQGVNKGTPGSLMRAAWRAGRTAFMLDQNALT